MSSSGAGSHFGLSSGRMRRNMLSRRTLLIMASVLGTLTCIIVWWAARTLIAPAGMSRTMAVIHSQRVEEEPTRLWRPYERERRYIVELAWGEGETATTGETEVSPFEYQRLHVGDTVPAFSKIGPPSVIQIKIDAAYEVFLVVLGTGSMVMSLVLVAVGLRLEDRVRDDDEPLDASV